MKKAWILAAIGLLTILFALGAVACSDDDDDDSGVTPEATEPVSETPGATAGEGATVSVTLSEYTISPDPATVAPGPVTFTASNIGGTVHELVVFKTDLALEALPTADDGSVNEAGEGVELIGEVEDVETDAEGEFSVDLEAGAYALICNVVQDNEDGTTTIHYGEGMYAPFTVE